MMQIEKFERVMGNIKNPIGRRVFGKVFLGTTLGAGLGVSQLYPGVAEGAERVDCPVTMFHGEGVSVIGRVVTQNLREGRVPVSASQLISIVRNDLAAPSPGMFCLTFDDGYESHYQTVMPYLERVGVPGTFFVLDPESWWGDRVHRYVSTEQIQDMVGRGMEVQSHGISHQNLVAIKGSARYWADLETSKSELEGVLQRTVDVFCYPFGAHDAKVREDVEKTGYRAGFSTISGTIQSSELLYRMLRRRP